MLNCCDPLLQRRQEVAIRLNRTPDMIFAATSRLSSPFFSWFFTAFITRVSWDFLFYDLPTLYDLLKILCTLTFLHATSPVMFPGLLLFDRSPSTQHKHAAVRSKHIQRATGQMRPPWEIGTVVITVLCCVVLRRRRLSENHLSTGWTGGNRPRQSWRSARSVGEKNQCVFVCPIFFHVKQQ